MLSKRKEPFRYTFEQPIDCLFEITGVNEEEVSSSKGKAQIINLSPHGIKLITSLEIPLMNDKSVFLTISFKLNEKTIAATGEIVWMKRRAKKYEYGLDLNESVETENLIIEQLKLYTKHLHLKDDKH